MSDKLSKTLKPKLIKITDDPTWVNPEAIWQVHLDEISVLANIIELKAPVVIGYDNVLTTTAVRLVPITTEMRDKLYPNPVHGTKIFNSDLKAEQVWYDEWKTYQTI